MIRVTIEIRGEADDVQGLKEKLAMDFERYGDIRVVEVMEGGNGQMRIGAEDDER